MNRDSFEQAVLFVRPDALGRKARFRHLNRLKSVTKPSERVIKGYTEFNVDDQKKILRDTITRTAKAAKAVRSVSQLINVGGAKEGAK